MDAEPQKGGNFRQNLLLAYAQQVVEARLYARIKRGLAEHGWQIEIITHLLSVWLWARRNGLCCTLLSGDHNTGVAPLPMANTPQAQLFCDALWQTLDRRRQTARRCAVSAYSTMRLSGAAVQRYAQMHGLAAVYFETGNVPGKLFVDPEGTGTDSLLARDRSVLDLFSVPPDRFDIWQKAYLAARRRASSPRGQMVRWPSPYYLLNRLGAGLGVPQPMPVRTMRKLAAFVQARLRRPIPPIKPADDYVLLPLPVFGDYGHLKAATNSNWEAITFAAARATMLRSRLVIRPHPAEMDGSALHELAELCRREGHLLTAWNTTELVLGAKEVAVQFSTVALEAKLFGVPLAILGENLFAAFTRPQTASYVLHYLVDFQLGGKGEAEPPVIERVVAILDGAWSAQHAGLQKHSQGPADARAR